jgi:hypothetical protein
MNQVGKQKMSKHERGKKPKENPSPEPLRPLKILHFLWIVNPTFFRHFFVPIPNFHDETTGDRLAEPLFKVHKDALLSGRSAMLNRK